MSITDTLTGLLGKAGSNPALLTTATQIAGMFDNVPVIGSLGKAGAYLSMADAAIRAKTGGEHSVFSAAAKAIEAAAPKFTQVIETCMGAACKAPGKEGGLQAAVAGLKDHLAAGAEAVSKGASGVVAQVTGKGAKLG